MLDVKLQHDCLKLSWIRRMATSQMFWAKYLQEFFVVPLTEIIKANLTFKSLQVLMKPFTKLPLFWEQIFSTWCKYNYRGKIFDFTLNEFYILPLPPNSFIFANKVRDVFFTQEILDRCKQAQIFNIGDFMQVPAGFNQTWIYI